MISSHKPHNVKGSVILIFHNTMLDDITARKLKKLVREPVERFSRLVFRQSLVDDTATCRAGETAGLAKIQ